MERQSNGVGKFLFCSVVIEEVKSFLLIFHKGRGFQGGWSILAEKIRNLGVISSDEFRGVVSPLKERSIQKERLVSGTYAEVIRKVSGVVGDAVWLQLGESEVKSREEQLRKCLVGWLGEVLDPLLDIFSLESVVTNLWSLKRGRGGEGGGKILVFGGTLLLLDTLKRAPRQRGCLQEDLEDSRTKCCIW